VNVVARRSTGRLVLTAVCLLTIGCSSTVSGNAVRDPRVVPVDVPVLRESQLDDVMLSLDELADVVGAAELETLVDDEVMSDNLDVASDPDCLGAVMGAEESVYAGSGWTAVRDQVVGDSNDEHWIEQTAVLFPSDTEASRFYDQSASAWEECAGYSVTIEDTDLSYVWGIGDLSADDDMLVQVTTEEESPDWMCQHALSAASNLIVETWACTYGGSDGAVDIAERMLDNARR
jgi:hypothetical protein